MRRATEVVPSARRLIKSLRDLGYDLQAAIADLVDNSITAEATNVKVETHWEGDDSWIRITDDGIGMTLGELREAMRFGTRRDYFDDDLGRFGLGLKAASLSQSSHLTVASRTTPTGRIHMAEWNLEHVEDSDRWEVLHPSPREVPEAARPLDGKRGTVVLWRRLDRVFRYRIPDGKRAKADFDRLANEVAQHLAMVFHRFLSNEAGRELPLQISVDGNLVAPWDPFAQIEHATVAMPRQRLRFVHDSTKHVVDVYPFVLPTEAAFSSPAAHRRAAGPQLWNRQQGFYIYRNARLIQSGGWNRLRTADEHTKLARIRVELPANSEELFELNIAKTQVRIPSALRPSLGAVASGVARAAQDAYRRPMGSPTERRSSLQPAESDPRRQVLRDLVRTVTSAVDELVAEEVVDGVALARIRHRMRDLEARFASDLDHAISEGRGRPRSQAGQAAPSSRTAAGPIEDAAVGS